MASAVGRAHARVLLRSSVDYKGSPARGPWFSLQYLDRTEAGRKHICTARAMEDKEKKKKDKNSSNSDRVTLKKEIGLLSACAIIIGECVTDLVLNGVFMKRSIR